MAEILQQQINKEALIMMDLPEIGLALVFVLEVKMKIRIKVQSDEFV